MRALIIGGAGFVGTYLINHIQQTYNWKIIATKLPSEKIEANDITIVDMNILNKNEIISILEQNSPDYIFHLAAQSSVAMSWQNPELTVDVNIKGSINVLDAIRTMRKKPRILLVGSSEEYGYIKPSETPVKEDNTLRPGNIYAATKAMQNMIGSIYARAYNLDVIMVRAFNHIGSNQSPLFVVADFCKQVADIEKGEKEAIIRVGNLKAKRDFTDVRDVVRAYTTLMLEGRSGETYNVGSGISLSIEEVLNLILSKSTKQIVIEIDENRLRPIDIEDFKADITRITEDTNWQKEIELEKTISNTLEYWRKK